MLSQPCCPRTAPGPRLGADRALDLAVDPGAPLVARPPPPCRAAPAPCPLLPGTVRAELDPVPGPHQLLPCPVSAQPCLPPTCRRRAFLPLTERLDDLTAPEPQSPAVPTVLFPPSRQSFGRTVSPGPDPSCSAGS